MTQTDGDHHDRAAWYLLTAQGSGLGDHEREQLARVRAALAAKYMWVAPRPELVDDVVEALDLPRRGRASRFRRGRSFWTGAMAGAATAAALVIAVAVLGLRRPGQGDDDAVHVALAGTDLAPAASARATVHETPVGVAIILDIEGLAAAPAGFYYQAWVNGLAGSVAVGTFHLRGDDAAIELWSGVDLAEYPKLTVTLEPEDGDPASSGQRVLAGDLGP